MILDLVFPKKCLGCSKKGIYICSDCLKKVNLGKINYSNISLFKYEGVIRKAIISLKYKYATDISEELADICIQELKKRRLIKRKNVVFVPIPLHTKRENERGFNQVKIIGKKIAKQMNWKFVPDLLIRTKQTKPQVQLKGSERRKNLSGVFKINQKYSLNPNSYILLFDDVYTTGSTINEARNTLRSKNLRNLGSLTIAK